MSSSPAQHRSHFAPVDVIPGELNRFIDNLGPTEMAEGLDVAGGILLVVDTDWNGVNYYGFAPEDSEIKFTGGVEFAENSVEQ